MEFRKKSNGVILKPAILALGTATPSHFVPQSEISQLTQDLFGLEGDLKEWYRSVHEKSAIERRYCVYGDDLSHTKSLTEGSMGYRNRWYKEHAPKLALEASLSAIKAWGGTTDQITHVISISCTGVMAPGIEAILVEKLGLSTSTNRLGLNMMGCFGAFKGLNVADAFAKANPKARILVVCTEICSLHILPSKERQVLLGNALFADGSGAVIVGAEPRKEEKPLWYLDSFVSHLIPDTQDEMTWEAGDKAFLMKLSHKVPIEVKGAVEAFLDTLIPSRECHFAIHPGGKAILEGIEKVCQLSKEETRASWEVLRKYGNMSSATFLFVLQEMNSLKKPWTLGLGFGPGLSMEGVLLKNV